MRDNHRLFVQIPSYRDPHLIDTILDMARQASRPSEIRVVVCWQHGPDEHIATFTNSGFRLLSTAIHNGRPLHVLEALEVEVELIDVPYLEAEGAGWARSITQQRYDEEAYNLQIDAHHRFSLGWDNEMINMLEELRMYSSKPLLTGHPPAFWPDIYPEGRQERAAVMLVDEFCMDAVVRLRSELLPDAHTFARPLRARFMSGGFVFSDGSFITEVPQDPNHFFATEEIVMTARAYTHGYDMYHPHRPLLWHYYGSPSPKAWDDNMINEVATDGHASSVNERISTSARRAMSLLRSNPVATSTTDGAYGLGMRRTLRDYERFAGLSFEHRGIHQSARSSVEPDVSHLSTPDAVWEQELACRRVIEVSIGFHVNRCIDIYSVEVVMETADGEIATVHRLSESDIKALIENGNFNFRYEHTSAPRGLPAAFEVSAVTDHQDAHEAFSVAAQEVMD